MCFGMLSEGSSTKQMYVVNIAHYLIILKYIANLLVNLYDLPSAMFRMVAIGLSITWFFIMDFPSILRVDVVNKLNKITVVIFQIFRERYHMLTLDFMF
jgi:UV DNA damage repair endonuclease